MNKYLNNTYSSLAVVFSDASNNTYIFDIPRIKYTSGTRVAGGINTDIIATLNWNAVMDPTELITMRITRFAGP
jgi:hypothetical protein